MKLFRYKNDFGTLILLDYDVLRETPAGYWIYNPLKGKGETWVARIGKKRFAYPTEQEALVNFIRRTERYLMFAKHYMDSANEALVVARKKEEESRE